MSIYTVRRATTLHMKMPPNLNSASAALADEGALDTIFHTREAEAMLKYLLLAAAAGVAAFSSAPKLWEEGIPNENPHERKFITVDPDGSMCVDPYLVPRGAVPPFDEIPPTGINGSRYYTCTADPPPANIAYYEAGDPTSTTKIIFTHGSPSRAHIWRYFTKDICHLGHCIMADNVGFGDSDKPPVRYGVIDMCQYFTAYVDAVAPNAEKIIFVAHDWGAMMTFDYAAKHKDKVIALTMFEGFAVGWPEVPNSIDGQYYSLVAGAEGERLVIEENFWLNLIQLGSNRPLPQELLDIYYAPWQTEDSRWPIRQFHLDIPIGTHPAHSFNWMESNFAALRHSLELQILVFQKVDENTPLTFPPDSVHAARFKSAFSKLDYVVLGVGNHFSQEDYPTLLAQTMAKHIEKFA